MHRAQQRRDAIVLVLQDRLRNRVRRRGNALDACARMANDAEWCVRWRAERRDCQRGAAAGRLPRHGHRMRTANAGARLACLKESRRRVWVVIAARFMFWSRFV